MPIYEYDCPKCGRFEVLQKPTEKSLKFCPSCAGQGRKTKVERLVSPAAFHLKGSGWYKTDYAAKSSSGDGKSNGTAAEDKGKESSAAVSAGSTKSTKSESTNVSAKNSEPSRSRV